jgi:hypothetical protein
MKTWNEWRLLVFLTWLRKQMDVPDRHDWYVMRLMAEVRMFRNGFLKSPPDIDLDDFKVRFKSAVVPGSPEDLEERQRQTDYAKAMWGLRTGYQGEGKPPAFSIGPGGKVKNNVRGKGSQPREVEDRDKPIGGRKPGRK